MDAAGAAPASVPLLVRRLVGNFVGSQATSRDNVSHLEQCAPPRPPSTPPPPPPPPPGVSPHASILGLAAALIAAHSVNTRRYALRILGSRISPSVQPDTHHVGLLIKQTREPGGSAAAPLSPSTRAQNSHRGRGGRDQGLRRPRFFPNSPAGTAC